MAGDETIEDDDRSRRLGEREAGRPAVGGRRAARGVDRPRPILVILARKRGGVSEIGDQPPRSKHLRTFDPSIGLDPLVAMVPRLRFWLRTWCG